MGTSLGWELGAAGRGCSLTPGLGGSSSRLCSNGPWWLIPVDVSYTRNHKRDTDFYKQVHNKRNNPEPSRQRKNTACALALCCFALPANPIAKANSNGSSRAGVWYLGFFFVVLFLFFSFFFQWCKTWEVVSSITDLPADGCSVNDYAIAGCTAEHSNQAHPLKREVISPIHSAHTQYRHVTPIHRLNLCKLVLLIYTAAFYKELIKPLRVFETQLWYFTDCTARSTAWQMNIQHLKSYVILGNSISYLDTVPQWCGFFLSVQ